MEYISTDFGVGSSAHLLLQRRQTDTYKHKLTDASDNPIHAKATANVGDYQCQ